MHAKRQHSRPLWMVLILLALVGCGGGGGNAGPGSSGSTQSYTIGGTVNGLTGVGLVLRNNGGNDLAIGADGSFTFTNPVASGAGYSVTVATQATNQNCTVTHANGIATSNITDIAVTCFALQSVVFTRSAGGTQDDLFVVKEDGSGLVPLAITADTERYRTYAPGGKIIYERGLGSSASVYAVNADGSGEVLLASNAQARGDIPTVTPAGRIILTRSNDLVSVNIDGTGLVNFGGTAGTESFAGFVPSGRVIFRRADTAQSDDWIIHSADADGGNEIQISPANTTEYEVPLAVTPSGRVIFERAAAISTGNPRDLFSVNEDGTGFVTLANNALSDEFVALIANERVIYQRGGELYSVGADGSGSATLTNSADNEYYVDATADGKVIYGREVFDPIAQTTQGDIYAINADGTGLVALATTTNHEYFGGVTPAGKILFSRVTGSGGERDLYLINSDGSGEQRLTATAEDESVDCHAGCVAPNGRLIFIRTVAGQADLYSINPDASDEAVLANSADAEYVGGLTTSRVIFVRDRGANQFDLYSVNTDGTDLKTLADTLDSEYFAAILSP